MNHAALLRQGLLVLVGIGILYALGQWDRRLSARDSALDRQTAEWLATSRRHRVRSDSLRTVASEALSRAETAALQAGRAEHFADSIEALLGAIVPDVIASDLPPEVRRVIVLQRLQVDSLRSANRELRGSLADMRLAFNLERQRADSAYQVVIPGLEKALKDENRARRCRIAWVLPCPSRTTAFVVGAVVGGGAAFLASR